jgi:hypothetical protein
MLKHLINSYNNADAVTQVKYQLAIIIVSCVVLASMKYFNLI